MLKISNQDVYGWEAAIRGMRNPMNSWNKSDSTICPSGDRFTDCRSGTVCPRDNDNFQNDIFCIGFNDLDLMKRLLNAGNDHSKFMRMITVTVDITAPLYWWKEFDTYKVGTVANSCSTMHKIQAKEFTLEDFSHEHLSNDKNAGLGVLLTVIDALNLNRELFISSKDKSFWHNMIQLLPTSYNQKRTVQLNYAVLRNIYHSRRNHKLDEWHTFCDFICSLPYSELITG